MKTDPNAMWLVSPDVRSTYSEDGAVLLDIRKGLCYSLNPVAARVWSTVEASPSGVDLRGLVDVMETHYPSLVSSSNVTSMGTYPSWNTWGLFNGTADFTGPRPPGRGVDMFRNTWSASVTTELSNAPAAWTCDSRETLSETRTNMRDFSANHSCIPPCGCGSRREGLSQNAPGALFFCRCPRTVASMANKSGERSLAGEGIDLMSKLPEL